MPPKKQPKVSILVPCYNVEKYLDECLTSIANQTLADIEIICIDDGSTDGTLDIIKKYAKDDKRFVIIDKENEGYGKSMNRGLDAATGEFVAIVESDDWVEPFAMEKLYNTAVANNADMVKAEFVFFDSDTRVESPSWGMGLHRNMHNTVIRPVFDAPQIIWGGHPSIWTCLYSNEMLKKYNIRFAETPGAAFQDMGFKPKTMVASKRFVYIPDVILHYRKHANNSDKNNNKIFAVCDAHDDTDKWAAEYMPNTPGMRRIMNMSRFANYVWNLRRLYDEPQNQFRDRFTREFIQIIRAGDFEKTYVDDKLLLKLYTVAFPHNPIWPILRVLATAVTPIYKNRIVDGHKTYFVFNRVPVYRRKLAKTVC